MSVVAWIPDEVQESFREVLRFVRNDQAHVHVIAAESRSDPPEGSCVLLIDRPVPWLDGFTAPPGERWHEYARALTGAALAIAAARGFGLVEIDVYEFAPATQEMLGQYGFAPEPGPPHYERNRIWQAPTAG